MPDVIVIGGGISGASATYALAREGLSVTLLEQHDLAAMASGWTLAGVRQSGRHPDELPLARAAVAIWNTLGEELGADVEYRQKGNLRLARDDAEAEILRELVDRQAALGLDLRFLADNDAVRTVAPAIAESVTAASFCPTDGHANPTRTVRAYARAAERLGAEIRLGEAADAIVVERGRVVGARSRSTVHRADRIVVATGVHAPALLKPLGLDLPINARMVTVVRTRPLPPLLDQVFGTARAICAGRQEASGRLRVTGGIRDWHGVVETADDGRPVVRPATGAVKGVIERGSFYLPAFGEAPLEDVWAGLIDMTPDGLPVIEATPEIEGLVIAAGFSGHGFGIGPVVGRLIRDLVLARPPDLPLDAFRRARATMAAGRQVETTLHG